MLRAAFVLSLALAASACARASATAQAAPPPVERAFYYWRTTFKLSAAERDALAALHVDKLYLRFFDETWNASENHPEIAGKLEPADPLPAHVAIVPVVFLRDEIFRHPSSPDLAPKTWAAIAERARVLGIPEPLRELQIDCDWTDSSRDAFFRFLRELRAQAPGPITLGATIRLHQVKYRERTGVPPVDRGMLMFYNMGRFSADPDARSIFDAASAGRYLARIPSYPLPLDAALPIWSWTVHLRDDAVDGLMQSTDPDDLDPVPFLRPDGPGRWIATETTFLHGELLREGDVLKAEITGPVETFAAAAMLAPLLARGARTVTLFDLSERNLHRHGIDSIDQIFGMLR